MAANSKLTLTSLDFDSLKADLKSYMQNQSAFSDYNFEGSGLDVLLSVLAYNTHYNAFYLNMVANEMFLDTAVTRQAAVSHAKALGYTPHSATASKATVNVAITRSNTDTTSVLSLPRFTQFQSESSDGVSYTFAALDDVTVGVADGVFSFNGIDIKEGNPVIKSFVVNNQSNPNQIFDLLDANIDTATIQIIVQKSVNNIQQVRYNLAEDNMIASGDSTIFFIQEGLNGNFQIYFGDSIVGKALDNGNIVVVSYLVTSAAAANSLKKFKLNSTLLSGATSNVITVTNSAGGSPIETVSSIKFSAPKGWVAQNRAVTKNDYIALINKKYPYFDAINIWGGEEENPPRYGKVFISVKPMSGYVVTEAQKQFLITDIIKPISVLTVTPEFVDPDYSYIMLDVKAAYNSKQTTKSAGQIRTQITSAIMNYADLNLNTFNSDFRYSRLLRAIDDSDASIEFSSADPRIEKRFTPSLTDSGTYTLTYGIPLHHGGINERLYSTPTFTIADAGGVDRDAYIEESPDSFSGLDAVDILTNGSGYTSAPTLTIVGDGTGANAYATIINGRVTSVTVDQLGSNYTTAIISASGGGGSGATFRSQLEGKNGVLRTYYFDNTQNKIILNASAGTVDYSIGTIILTDFSPTAINNVDGALRIVIKPDEFSFSPTKRDIFTIDSDDDNAISIELIDTNNS